MFYSGMDHEVARKIQEGHLRDAEQIRLVELLYTLLPGEKAEPRPSRRGVRAWLGSVKLALAGHRS